MHAEGLSARYDAGEKKKSKGHIMRAPQIFQLSRSFLQRLQKHFLAGSLCGGVVTVTLTESNWLLWKISLSKHTSLKSLVSGGHLI